MREIRNLSAYTKQQISNSMKKYHASKSEEAKLATRQKQSIKMKAYWETIPTGEDIGSTVKGCQNTRKCNVQPSKK